jgi:hypothetical protein
MTSTLLLWRSLGVVMGVSFSSLILQNALTAYLNALVTGRHKDEVWVRYDRKRGFKLTKQQIILTVRKSVRSIIDLDPKHQAQVIQAYDRSLKVTFISAIVVFVAANILILAIKLPTLRKKDAEEEVEEQTSQ